MKMYASRICMHARRGFIAIYATGGGREILSRGTYCRINTLNPRAFLARCSGFCSTGASDVKLKRTPKPIAKKRRALTRCLQRGWRQNVATMQARQIAQCNLTSYVTWTLLKVTCIKIEINNALKRFYSCKPSTFYKPQTFPDILSTVASFFSLFCLLTRHN